MVRRFIQPLVVAVIFILGTANTTGAQSWFERLVMPGSLIEGHAKFEPDCSNCHAPFSKETQRDLCLDCHKDTALDVRNNSGYHGKRLEVSARECNHCHTEHIGREADIVALDEETFNHDITDFPIKNSHQKVGCVECHKPGKPYRAAPSRCVDCHEPIDPHKGRLGRECSSCHSEVDWKKIYKFDHSRTEFVLEGSHKSVSCGACHIGEIYKDLPSLCVNCHNIQDAHKGRYGEKCSTCHTPAKWKEVKFNHDNDTKFRLLGKHQNMKCDACHTGILFAEKKLSIRCISCHGRDDPHKNQLGDKCETCHSAKGWRDELVFDHDITSFPLIGLHALVPCEGCHLSSTYHDAQIGCVKCHRSDDYHALRLGTKCEDCHNPNGWRFWSFNHDVRTNYPLDGAHSGLDCHACHTKSRAKNLVISQQCVSCHEHNDKHVGKYGRQCGTCHVTSDFKKTRLR